MSNSCYGTQTVISHSAKICVIFVVIIYKGEWFALNRQNLEIPPVTRLGTRSGVGSTTALRSIADPVTVVSGKDQVISFNDCEVGIKLRHPDVDRAL